MQEGEEMTAETFVYEILKELLIRKSELYLGSHERQTLHPPPTKKNGKCKWAKVNKHILNDKL